MCHPEGCRLRCHGGAIFAFLTAPMEACCLGHRLEGEGPAATLTPFVLWHHYQDWFVLFSIVFPFFVLEYRFSHYSPGTCSVHQPGIKGVVTVIDLTQCFLRCSRGLI